MTLSDTNKEKVVKFLEDNIGLIDFNNWYALLRKCPLNLITPLLEFIQNAKLEIKDAEYPFYVIEDNDYALTPSGVYDSDFISIACQHINFFRYQGKRINFIRFKNPLAAEAFRKNYLFNHMGLEFVIPREVPSNHLKVRINGDSAFLKSRYWVKINTHYGECYIEESVANEFILNTPIILHELEIEGKDKPVLKTHTLPNWWLEERE